MPLLPEERDAIDHFRFEEVPVHVYFYVDPSVRRFEDAWSKEVLAIVTKLDEMLATVTKLDEMAPASWSSKAADDVPEFAVLGDALLEHGFDPSKQVEFAHVVDTRGFRPCAWRNSEEELAEWERTLARLAFLISVRNWYKSLVDRRLFAMRWIPGNPGGESYRTQGSW